MGKLEKTERGYIFRGGFSSKNKEDVSQLTSELFRTVEPKPVPEPPKKKTRKKNDKEEPKKYSMIKELIKMVY